MDLWVQRLCAHGIGSFWIYDGLFNIDKIGAAGRRRRRPRAPRSMPCILFADSPYHTDEYYAEKTRELVALGVDGIELEDAAGVLTPERDAHPDHRDQRRGGDVPLELHFHTNNGLAQLNYLEGLQAGADLVHTLSRPLADGRVAALHRGHPREPPLRRATTSISTSPSPAGRRAHAARRRAEGSRSARQRVRGVHLPPPAARRDDRDVQGPAGARGMEDRFEEVLDEMRAVRAELGYPVMATPFSQLVGTQAVLNVVTGSATRSSPTRCSSTRRPLRRARGAARPGRARPRSSIAAGEGAHGLGAAPAALDGAAQAASARHRRRRADPAAARARARHRRHARNPAAQP